jgi:hypothetical protein
MLTELAAAVAKAKASGKKLEEVKKDFALPRCEKWPGYKELLPVALERLWESRLPAPSAEKSPAAPAPAPAPVPAGPEKTEKTAK